MKNLIILCLVFCTSSLFSQNLTGAWSCNDGATYSIRQNGNEMWWFGDGAPKFRNVFHGKIHGNLIYGDWSDVPGGDLRNFGSLTIKIVSNNDLELVWSSSGFGNKWTRKGQSIKNSPVKNEIVYNTTMGKLTLKPDGNQFTGTYESGNGTLRGTLSGNVLTDTWSNSSSKKNGTFQFVFEGALGEGSGFTGKWGYNDEPRTRNWSGKEI